MQLTDRETRRVQELAKQNGGTLTPDAVIADAQDESSPLHHRFQWDTAKAAMEHWRDTARAIIRSVRVEIIVDDRQVSTVAYVRDPEARKVRSQGYIGIEQVDSANKAEVILDEISRAEASMRRALGISAALGLEQDTKKALQGVLAVKRKARKVA